MIDIDQAIIHHERGQLGEAEAIYIQALNQDFDNTKVLFYYGTLLMQQGKYGFASNVLRMSLRDGEDNTSVYQNLANCYKGENREKECEEILMLALAQKPNAELWASLGNLHINAGTPEKALEYYRKGLDLDPQNDLIKFHMGLANLERGDYPAGWAGYEHGFRAGNRVTRDYRGLPVWDGTPGMRVIVWGEQGIGDEILFASCIHDAIHICKKVIFDCHPRLLKIFKHSFGIECHGTRKNQVLDWYKPEVADAHCSITMLAKLFRNDRAEFPRTPYLKCSWKDIARHRRAGDGRLRVGLSWTGGVKQTRRDLRSMSLEVLRPIIDQNCDFYSLQYTPESAREVCEFEESTGIRIKHFPGLVECKDYEPTMNFIASMDLVVSVCTTAIHAAGAVGVPCWIMTPAKAAWRYGLKGERHDWYGSVRMFRQNHGEDWGPVVRRIADELGMMLSQRRAAA